MVTLATLNACTEDQFAAHLDGVFEHAPWVPRAAFAVRPFASVEALHAAMLGVVAGAGEERQTALLRAHPELARPGALTAASAAEQGGMGLQSLDNAEAERFDALNAAYRERFGFPFIIAVRGQRDRAAILAALTERLANAPATERAEALAQVGRIARFRLEDRVHTGGRLTVHVLDTATGTPAAGLEVVLSRLEGEDRAVLGRWRTNQDGRSPAPLLEGTTLHAGSYELLFDVAAWRASRGEAVGGFYDTVPIRFVVRDTAAHYHVPLLLAPFGYSTYRGS